MTTPKENIDRAKDAAANAIRRDLRVARIAAAFETRTGKQLGDDVVVLVEAILEELPRSLSWDEGGRP